ncbi:NAD(P)/FAD-dependent oxidoreductase [Spirochaeta cellobiosiphila]|uniref:NAD(P)/FAD-dependent oxidoreductase n=1 Tax=Spirochaeta cellobiosiphila TaxID=504483 RepID=UPI0003FD21CC|nr:FAD-binding oxidoreductase [Spirochaeta cellobiosiphila]
MYDFHIVGGGFAGLTLAYKLIQKGAHVLLQDHFHSGSGTIASGALLNPLSGPHLALPTQGGPEYSRIIEDYHSWEQKLSKQLLTPHKHLRVLANDRQKRKLLNNQDKQSFVRVWHNTKEKNIIMPLGAIDILQTYVIDPHSYIRIMKNYLQQQGSYLQEEWDPKQPVKANKTILCMGPFDPFAKESLHYVRGETLIISLKEPLDYILSKGVALIPLNKQHHGKHLYKLGSTYDRYTPLEYKRTTKGREDLLHQLRQFYTGDVQVVGHQYGVRPVGPDRSSLWGLHPDNDKYYILNGMGSKGTLNAPYYADLLITELIS